MSVGAAGEGDIREATVPADGSLCDLARPRQITASRVVHPGMIWDVVQDTVDLGEAGTVRREYVRHPGAVAIVALDEHDRVVMIRQYRHPTRAELWEVPAGLMDVSGEEPHLTAARELLEETDLEADSWHVLVDWFPSPGAMDEALRLYLARGLHPVEDSRRHTREAEERGMPLQWVPLDEAVEAVLSGRMHNATAMLAVLTAAAARDRGWSGLLPARTPWPWHPRLRP
jgi:8-oxo-dGDP phosphatase